MSRKRLERSDIDLDSLAKELSSTTGRKLNLVVDYKQTGNDGNGDLIVKDYDTDEEVDIDDALLTSELEQHVPPSFTSPIEMLEVALADATTVAKLRAALREYAANEGDSRNPL